MNSSVQRRRCGFTRALLALFALLSACADDDVLIRELVSREVSIHVGGVQTPEIKEVVSREVSLFIQSGPADPYHEVISREVSLAITSPEPPPAVTGVVVTPSPAGDRVELDWRSYNQWAVGDIAGFAIYRTNKAFTDITGMTPLLTVPAEHTGTLLTGLPTLQDHFFAVVAVDVLGNFDPAVTYFGAYVLSPQAISREVSLFIGAEPNPPYREVVSREVSLLMFTPEAPPAVTDVRTSHSPAGDVVTLDWSTYNQWSVGDVAHYDIYLSARPFTSVSGLTRYAKVSGETLKVTLKGLPTFQDHFFAVVPVDGGGNLKPTVSYAGAYVLMGQVVSREVSLFVGAEPNPPYREVVSREVSIVVPDGTVPAAVTGVDSGFKAVTSLLRPRALALDWSSYNEVGQRDVTRYRLYLGSSYFESVTGMKPASYIPAGTQRLTLDGLASATIYYVAMVAEDVQTNFNPVVRSVSAITTPKLEMAVPNQTLPEGGTLSYQLEVTEKDLTGYDLKFALVSGQAGMAVTPGGVLTWTTTEADGPGVHPVVVSVTDNGVPAVTALDEFTVTVQEINTPPVFSNVTSPTVDELTPLGLTLAATDTDLPVQVLTFGLVSGPTGLSVAGDGTVIWTPTEVQGPGSFPVNVSVTDGVVVVTQDFTVTVKEVNASPVFAVVGPQSVDELATLKLSLSATDSDVPVQELNYALVSGPVGMAVTATGLLTWTAAESDGPGSFPVKVSVADGVATVTQDFSVTVNEVNVPPTLADPEPQSVDELATWKLTLTASDPDIPVQALNFGILSGPAGLTVAEDGAVVWTPSEVQGPSTNVVFVRVGDGTASATNSFIVTVKEVNASPVLAMVDPPTVDELTALTLNLTATDSDVPVQMLNYALVTGPVGMAVTPAGALTWTPAEADGPGDFPVQVSVTDGVTMVTQDFTVTVNEVNVPPILVDPGPQAVTAGSELLLLLVADDTDLPSQALSFQLLDSPAGATLDATTGQLRWRPEAAQLPGDYTFITQVTDALGGLVRRTFTVTEQAAVSMPPVVEIGVSSGGGLHFAFEGQAGHTYRLETTLSLTPVNWQLVEVLTSTDGLHYETDVILSEGKFGEYFRVITE